MPQGFVTLAGELTPIAEHIAAAVQGVLVVEGPSIENSLAPTQAYSAFVILGGAVVQSMSAMIQSISTGAERYGAKLLDLDIQDSAGISHWA